ncbi:bifunctional riboflavin kinase/FAD synthetase [Thermodesulfobacteriota bacterium]
MKLIREIGNLKGVLVYPVVTLGNFDGVHLGHRHIFDQVIARARQAEGESVVYTLDPHPMKVLKPGSNLPLITSTSRKIELIESCGIDVVICDHFSEHFAERSPEQFVRDILVNGIRAREVLVGDDYRFGRGRSGDIKMLADLGREFGFDVAAAEQVEIDGVPVRSTRIREMVRRGDVDGAAKLLGRPYILTGTVTRGAGRGKTIGFPTANLETTDELIPATGVYAGLVMLGGNRFGGAINLGTNPTFDGKTFSIEVYILDFSREIYGETMEIHFVSRLRDEMPFGSPDELCRQIDHDVSRAREILHELLSPER